MGVGSLFIFIQRIKPELVCLGFFVTWSFTTLGIIQYHQFDLSPSLKKAKPGLNFAIMFSINGIFNQG